MGKPIENFQFDNFSDFLSEFPRILFPNSVFEREKYVFRGHGDSNYLLQSSFDRRFSSISPVERVTLYKEFAGLLQEEFSRSGRPDLSLPDLLGLAQHYGSPTRMLDWSSSPLVASYFAFHSNLMSENPARFVSIWALCTKSALKWDGLGLRFGSLESRENSRARLQLGFATNLEVPDESLEEFVSRIGVAETVLWRFDILADDARSAFAFLDVCNTRASALFGEAEGAARTAFERLAIRASDHR